MSVHFDSFLIKCARQLNGHFGEKDLRIMKKQELFFRGRCEHSNLTELLYLDKIQDDDEKKRAQLHLQHCLVCKNLFSDLELQYKFISREVLKPVSNKTLDLAKKISSKDTKYGLVVCEPVVHRKATKDSTPYKTKVLFTANGAGPSKSKKLADFSLGSLPDDSIAIRAMTDKKRNKLLLYLWSPQNEDFEGWELLVSTETGKAKFGPSGMSQIPLMEIEDLHGKVIYFKEKQNAFASGDRFTKPKSPISTL